MRAHGDSALRHFVLSSTTERVTRYAPCPVLTITEKKINAFGQDYDGFPPSAWKRILMPVDFSFAAKQALKHAAALAIENHAKLLLLNVVAGNSANLGVAETERRDDANELTPDAGQRLVDWVREGLPLPVRFETAIWVGFPSLHAILLEPKRSKIDLIVLPTRNYSWAERLRLGSNTECILRHSPCAVLSVHEDINQFEE
jgi:nucleotide-binding universal stress UspA family protein